MTQKQEYLVNCIITKKDVVVKKFTIDYNDKYERTYLGQQCARAIYSGCQITTWPDSTNSQ